MSTISRHKSATSLAPSITELDLVHQFSQKFKGQLSEPFNKILRERIEKDNVNRVNGQQYAGQYTIQEGATEELQDYALKHLANLCAAPFPQRISDVEERMSKLCLYLRPSKIQMEEMQKTAEKGKKRELCLPVDRINSRLLKESGVKLEQPILIYVVANVEHISQKILQIAVNYVNQIKYHIITAQDIKLLIKSFCQDSSAADLKDESITYMDRFPKNYEDGLKEILYFEDQFIRQLNIIIRLFRDPIERLYPNTADLNHIFSSVNDIRDVTTDLLSAIEETFEVDEKPVMTGACFCDIMEANGFQHYKQYASDILSPKCRGRLQALMENHAVKDELLRRGRDMQSRLRNEKAYRSGNSICLLNETSRGGLHAPAFVTDEAGMKQPPLSPAGSFISTQQAYGEHDSQSASTRTSTTTLSIPPSSSSLSNEYVERNLMLNAARYLLPRLLLIPVYHFLYYSQILEKMKTMTTGDDESNIRSVLSDMSPQRTHIQNLLCGYPALQNESNRMKTFFRTRLASTSDKKIATNKLDSLQRFGMRIEGPYDAVGRECNEFIFEGPLYQKSEKRLTDRYVFLFDGYLFLCKHNERRVLSPQVMDYKLKRKIPLYRFDVYDLPNKDYHESEEYYSFIIEFEDSLRGDVAGSVDQPRERIILATKSPEEKADWMATLITLQCWPSLEKFLTLQMAEEDRRQPLCLPSVEQYRFAVPDSSTNIVFEEQAENSTDVPLVRGGTLLKLVERLTYHTYVDTKFVKTFMMTYRDFTEPLELMDLLIERFNIPDPIIKAEEGEKKGDTDLGVSSMQARLKRFKKEYKKPVQLRVINVLRHWVDHHYSDFQRESELLVKQEEAFKEVDNRCILKGVGMIKSIIKRAQTGKVRTMMRTSVQQQQVEMKPIGVHLVRDYLPDDDYSLMRLHPVELGRQLTLMQFQYYRMIEPSELVGEKWMDRERKHVDAPNVIKTIEFSNKISNWFKYCIVIHEEVTDRVAVMTRICEILYVFEELKNFAGFMEVLGVVDSSAIHRLEWTFANIPKRPFCCQEVLDRVRDLMNAEHGRKYLEKLRSIDPPCVPFLGTFLTNIDHISVGNSDWLDKESQRLINFSKRRKIGEIVAEIQQYQNQSYRDLQELPELQKFLNDLEPFRLANVETELEFEDFLYAKSLHIEPRNCTKLPNFEPRMTQEELKLFDMAKEIERLSKPVSKMFNNPSKTIGSSGRSISPPSPRTNSPSIPTIPEAEPLPPLSSSPQPVQNRGLASFTPSPSKYNYGSPPPLPRRSVTQNSPPTVQPTLSPGPSINTWRSQLEHDDRCHLQPNAFGSLPPMNDEHGYSKSDPVHMMTDGANGGSASISPSLLSASPAESAPAIPPPLPPRRHDSSMSSSGNPPYSAGLQDPVATVFFPSPSPPSTPVSGPPLPPRRKEDGNQTTPRPQVPPRPARRVRKEDAEDEEGNPPPLPPRRR